MISDNSNVDSRLSRQTRNAIEAFQRYIVTRYRQSSESWPLSRPLMRDIAKGVLDQFEEQSHVVDPGRAAELLNIRLSFSKSEVDNLCGGITPTRRGFNAIIFGSPSESRTRFTIAHECGHTFFYFLGSIMPQRIVPRDCVRDSKFSRREEGLCDVFAGELLLPGKYICKVAEQDMSLERVLAEASQRGVSLETLLRRVLYDANGWGSAVFYLIRKSGPRPIVRSYRGLRRRRDYNSTPSSNTIINALGGIEQREMSSVLEALFRREYKTAKPEISVSGYSIWVKV